MDFSYLLLIVYQMNSLTSLLKVCSSLPFGKEALTRYEAGRFSLRTLKGKSIADVGCEPILHMRHYQVSFNNAKPPFSLSKNEERKSKKLKRCIYVYSIFQATKKLPEKLINQILGAGNNERIP